MTEEQIKHMAQRFLNWPVPEDFGPDAGITFEPIVNAGTSREYRHHPVGTNILTYTQAVAMVRHMVEGLPAAETADGGNASIERTEAEIAAYKRGR